MTKGDDEKLIIGLMSGTSLDGLDIAACSFNHNPFQWEIVQAQTIPYSEGWQSRLSGSMNLNANELIQLDREYGDWLGDQVLEFCEKNDLSPHCVASHGHTVFHRPDLAYTLQIGSIPNIASRAKCTVVGDFRSGDVALGGQGAPLVPIGDKLLFPEFDACINLGGFANISFHSSERMQAFDICPFNLPLNHLSKELGAEYDKDGALGKSGTAIPGLKSQLRNLSFFNRKPPKSLGREWLDAEFMPIVQDFKNHPAQDRLATLYQLFAELILDAIAENNRNILVTGGGALNRYLIELLKQGNDVCIHVPEKRIVEFKEALIFAFMGWLRLEGKVNVLASVTGATVDHSSGVIYPYSERDI